MWRDWVSVSYVRKLFVVSQENSVLIISMEVFSCLLIQDIEIPPLFAEQGQFLFKVLLFDTYL